MLGPSSLFGDLPLQFAPIGIQQSGLDPVWTEHKAKLIAGYLRYFVFITHHGAYIDGFAAPKKRDLPDSWAAELVVTSEPRRLRQIFLCELNPRRAGDLDKLVAAQPDGASRYYQVLKGDFNETVHEVLGSGMIRDRTATFCLIDQYTMECHWATLEALAKHKAPGNRRIELFYFLATGWLGRALGGFKKNVSIPERWWGRPDWRDLQGKGGDIIAIRMAERFRDELGYRYVHPYPIWQKKKGKGRVMFHMIHASDHEAAPGLMRRAHRSVTLAPEPLEQLEIEFDIWARADAERDALLVDASQGPKE